MIDELDIPWDPDSNSVFSGDDVPLSTICTLIELPSFIVDPSWRPAPTPSPWSRCDVWVLLSRPPPWPNWDAWWRGPSLDKVEFPPPQGKWWGHHTSC